MRTYGDAMGLVSGVKILAVGLVGFLGLVGFAQEGQMGMAAMFAAVRPIATGLGVLCIWRFFRPPTGPRRK